MTNKRQTHNTTYTRMRRRRRSAQREDAAVDAHALAGRPLAPASIHAQAAHLREQRLPTAERQAVAEAIGQTQGNRALVNTLAVQHAPVVARQDNDADSGVPNTVADIKAKEALIEQIYGNLQGKPPKDRDQGKEAITKVAEAALETETGKQIQKQVKQYLFSKKGAPVTIMLGSAGVAAMIANNTDVPTIPIPLSENMKLTIDVKGSITKPEAVMATFELKF
jgi:hypothetical protein